MQEENPILTTKNIPKSPTKIVIDTKEDFIREVERHLTSKENDNKRLSINSMITYIQGSGSKFIDLLEILTPWINQVDDTTENIKALDLLSEVLSKAENLDLNAVQIRAIFSFIKEKMRIVSTINSSIKVFEALVLTHCLGSNNQRKNFKKGEKQILTKKQKKEKFDLGIDLLNQVFELTGFDLAQYAFDVRSSMLKCVMFVIEEEYGQASKKDKKLTAESLSNTQRALIFNIVKHLHSEKDPRNLMMMLRVYLLLLGFEGLSEVDSTFLESIFETCAMYFPITFKNTSDTIKLDPDDIRGLLDVILTHPEFVDETLNLVFQKLGESDNETRISTLKTLIFIVKVNRNNNKH